MHDPAAARLARIERRVGVPGLADRLAALPSPDLQALLLELDRRRVARRSPAAVLARYAQDRTLVPAPTDARALHAVAAAAFAAAAEFDAVELAPVAPLGLNHVLGGVDVRNVLPTVRGSEVVADSTTVHALEAARRRRAGAALVRLCSNHRVLRLQPFPPPSMQHFRLFALSSAGRETAHHGFHLAAVETHLRAHLRFLTGLERDGRRIGAIRVEVADVQALDALARDAGTSLGAVLSAHRMAPDRPPEELVAELGVRLPPPDLAGVPQRLLRGPLRRLLAIRDAVLPALAAAFPDVQLALDLTRVRAAGYYSGLMVDISATGPSGTISLADGGSTPWAGRLLADRREAMFVTGLGLDRVAALLEE
jgi:hypothetical protein